MRKPVLRKNGRVIATNTTSNDFFRSCHDSIPSPFFVLTVNVLCCSFTVNRYQLLTNSPFPNQQVYSHEQLTVLIGDIMRFSTLPVSFLGAIAYGSSSIDAFSAGAGGCTAGEAAVGATHLSITPTNTGTLGDGGFSVVVDETTFPSSVSLEVGEEHTIYVRGSQFRGVLIMSDASPDDVSLSPFDNLLQESTACDGAGYPGITHTNSDLKSEVEGVLFCLTEGTYNIGVTVVVSNNAQEGSTYYYTGFPLVCGGGGGGVTATENPVTPGAPSMAPAEAEIPVIGGDTTTTPPAVETTAPPGSETTTPPASNATSTSKTLLLSLGAAFVTAVVAWAI
jgi:hypothetical protein